MFKKIGTVVILLLILFFLWIGYSYLHYRSINAVSDAAFIKSDKLAYLSFKVGGKVIKMEREENAPVKKGELLAEIDSKDFLLAKLRAVHSRDAMKDKLLAMELKRDRLKSSLDLKEEMSKIDINSAEKQISSMAFRIDSMRIKLKKLNKDLIRYRNMANKNLISSDKLEEVETQKNSLADTILAMKEELNILIDKKIQAEKAYELAKVSKKQILELQKSILAQRESIKAQNKLIKEMNNKISYTKIYAPFDGVVAKKFFDAPKVVKKGYPVYAVIEPDNLYCEVLLSEKKLKGVYSGNRVKITVDAYENRNYYGEVESIAPTSASTFSLVPRDIASGEFTKLDQRFIVRIKLENIDGLRAGMGATVAIARKNR